MLKIGLTGGIGSGKSLVCRVFETLGIPVYYADKEAKKLMWRDKPLKFSIQQLIGSEAYLGNGRLNRKFIAAKVFKDKGLLEKLNSLVHPAVAKDLDRWMLKQNTHYAIEEAALIFEAGNHLYFDKIITVAADDELRIARVMDRDQVQREAVMARMKHQLDQSEKIRQSDYVIYNNGKKSLIHQIMLIHRELLNISS